MNAEWRGIDDSRVADQSGSGIRRGIGHGGVEEHLPPHRPSCTLPDHLPPPKLQSFLHCPATFFFHSSLFSHLFPSFPQGVGKTTLVTRVFESMRSSHPNLNIRGFYTRTRCLSPFFFFFTKLGLYFGYWRLYDLFFILCVELMTNFFNYG